MDEVQEIDVEQIMERIREDIKRRRGLAESPEAEGYPSPFEDGQATVDFTYLHSGYDIRHGSFASHRRMLGRLAVAVKQNIVDMNASGGGRVRPRPESDPRPIDYESPSRANPAGSREPNRAN